MSLRDSFKEPAVPATPKKVGRPPKDPYEGRKRKASWVEGGGTKIWVDPSLDIHTDYELYVMTDEGARISAATSQDDWEHVTYFEIGGQETGNVGGPDGRANLGGGENVSFVVGTKENGLPSMGMLMKKRKEWYLHDKAVSQAERDKQVEALQGPGGGLIDKRAAHINQR